ncbi:MAG TPA: PilZ domain-containing protein [Solirubrobacteraceae bacterium]|nr:PilZ domain-containing protein [Solirubrobacteraceae bacterium]
MDERRNSPRARVALPCLLRQETSSPIWAETIDVGVGGMSVRAARPLRPHMEVDFELASAPDEHVEGRATVMRKHAPRVYGLRFQPLAGPMQERLEDIVLDD